MPSLSEVKGASVEDEAREGLHFLQTFSKRAIHLLPQGFMLFLALYSLLLAPTTACGRATIVDIQNPVLPSRSDRFVPDTHTYMTGEEWDDQ
eukprot:6492112-Amphidinium_carterae.2